MGLRKTEVQGKGLGQVTYVTGAASDSASPIFDFTVESAAEELQAFSPVSQELEPELALFFDGNPVKSVEVFFTKDISIPTQDINGMGEVYQGSVMEKQIALYSKTGPGKATRPQSLTTAKAVHLASDGTLLFIWKTGAETWINNGHVASWLVVR